jgi:hypothetical protein
MEIDQAKCRLDRVECGNAAKDGSVRCDASRGEMTGSAEKTRGNLIEVL